jgi:hypothetical protein
LTEVEAGFLIVLRFDVLYARFVERHRFTRDWYAIPRVDRDPSMSRIRYRGTDREALGPACVESCTLAEMHLADLEKRGRCVDGILSTIDDVQETIAWLEEERDRHETIWLRKAGARIAAPPGFVSMGFDPSYLDGDHFSASCDCMMFPKWHGTDEEGTLFLEHFRRLNPSGLFDSAADATAFTDFYCSFDWTENERSDYEMVEVFRSADGPAD